MDALCFVSPTKSHNGLVFSEKPRSSNGNLRDAHRALITVARRSTTENTPSPRG
jgi:hypothetical protein